MIMTRASSNASDDLIKAVLADAADPVTAEPEKVGLVLNGSTRVIVSPTGFSAFQLI